MGDQINSPQPDERAEISLQSTRLLDSTTSEKNDDSQLSEANDLQLSEADGSQLAEANSQNGADIAEEREENPDRLEEELGHLSRPVAYDLWKDYRQIKARPGRRFVCAKVHISSFQPSSGCSTDISLDELLTPGTTFCDCLKILCDALEGEPESGSVQTCVLLADLDSGDLYPGRALFLTTDKSYRRKCCAPFKSLFLILHRRWDFSKRTKAIWGGIEIVKQDGSYVTRPSKAGEPFRLESTEESFVRIGWLQKAPDFKGRLDTYVDQPYGRPQSRMTAYVVLCPKRDANQNVLITLSPDGLSQDMFTRCKSLLDQLFDGSAINLPTWGVVRSLCALCALLVEDTEMFAQSVDEKLCQLIYEGRVHPSSGRLQYLLCLDDCCDLSARGLQDASKILEAITIDCEEASTEAHDKLRKWLDAVESDIEHLLESLDGFKKQVADVRFMIKEQLELRNSRRTSLLTILAAIYIPFSFVSSLFGMNLKDPLSRWNSRDSQHNSRLASNASMNWSDLFKPLNASSDLSDMEKSTPIDAIASSGPHLFIWKQYWVSACGATLVTILVPVIAGPVFRSVTRFLMRHRMLWVPIPMIFLIVLALVLNIVPTTRTLLTTRILLIFLIIGPAVVTAAITLLSVSKSGKHQLLWCGFTITLCFSLWLDNFRSNNPPTTILPFATTMVPAYLMITHLRSQGTGLSSLLRVPYRAVLRGSNGSKGNIKREALRVGICTVCYIIANCYWIYCPDSGALATILFVILGINRVVRNGAETLSENPTSSALNPRRAPIAFRFWIAFQVVWIVCAAADNHVPDNIRGMFISLFPMTAIFMYWVYLDYKVRFDKFFRTRVRRHSRQVVAV